MARRAEDLTPPFFELDFEVIGADTKHVYLLALRAGEPFLLEKGIGVRSPAGR